MQKFPKMHINSYIYFCQKVPHVQNYVYINTCYTTNNKNGEKSRFVNHFSLQDWLQLTNSQKHGHQLEVTRAMVNILNSVFEKEFSHTFQKAMIVAHNLSTQESSKEKGKNVEKSVRQTKQIITKSMEKNDTDATILLSWANHTVSMKENA